MKWWNDLSITKKLYLVIGTMAVFIAAELVTLRFTMQTLSAVRAFVGGEGSWSKAQKNAAISLQRYAVTHSEGDYQDFLTALQVPEGDHRARLEMLKAAPDWKAVRAGFELGKIHPDDVDGVIALMRRSSRVSYLAEAIRIWARGDDLLAQFRAAGVRYHDLWSTGRADLAAIQEATDRIHQLNAQLTTLEDEFSKVLGEGSRWLEHVLLLLMALAVLTVEGGGLTLTFFINRRIARGLGAVHRAAKRIGAGDFSPAVDVKSGDEIGLVADAVAEMGSLLQQSYKELEKRVQQRSVELRAMADANSRLYEEAVAAVEMRDEYFSIASHELRTPLATLHLQLQMLARSLKSSLPPGPQASKLEQQVERCLKQSQRLSTLSSELMDLTRIRLGKLELKPEQCDLVAIAKEVVGQLGTEAARTGSSIEVHAASPVAGSFDPTRFTQVVTNLVSNAIKYGDGKPIEVVVDTIEAGNVARLVVRDQGKGIAPEDQARVFERFERAEKDTKISGLGLGLYITQQIVLAHGGTISVQSELGRGSAFTVSLALGQSASTVAASA